MKRLLVVALLLVATMASTYPSAGKQLPEQPSAIGGIGNTRSDLDLAYGTVERSDITEYSDYSVDAVSYEDEWVFYLIEDGTAPSPDDRAFIIHRYAEPFESFVYFDAIAIANKLLPADVVPTSDLVPVDINGTVVEYRQSFYSDSIARLFPDPEIYREGDPGTVWLLLTPDLASSDPSGNFVTVNVRIEHP